MVVIFGHKVNNKAPIFTLFGQEMADNQRVITLFALVFVILQMVDQVCKPTDLPVLKQNATMSLTLAFSFFTKAVSVNPGFSSNFQWFTHLFTNKTTYHREQSSQISFTS